MRPEYSSKRKWECFANHCRNHKQGRRQKNPGMCHNTTVKWGQVEGWKELCLWQVQVYKPQFLQVVRGICIPMMASGHNTRLKPKVAIRFFVLLSFSYAGCLFSLSPEWGLCWHPWLWCLLPSVIHLNPLNVGTDSINSQGSRLLVSCLKVAVVDSSLPMDLTQKEIGHLLTHQHHLLDLRVGGLLIWKLTQPTQTNLKEIGLLLKSQGSKPHTLNGKTGD